MLDFFDMGIILFDLFVDHKCYEKDDGFIHNHATEDEKDIGQQHVIVVFPIDSHIDRFDNQWYHRDESVDGPACRQYSNFTFSPKLF